MRGELKHSSENMSYKGCQTYRTGTVLLAQMVHQGKVKTATQLLGKIEQLEASLLPSPLMHEHWPAYKNTFHCTINDKWYNEAHLCEVWADIANPKKPVPLDYVDLVVWLLCRKMGNYGAVGVFFDMLSQLMYGVDLNWSRFESRNDYEAWCFMVEEKPISSWGYSGYCCEDHSGPYEQWLWYEMEDDAMRHVSDLKKRLFDSVPSRIKNAKALYKTLPKR